jgi:hypothetical protein
MAPALPLPATSLVPIRPERNEWRYYCLEVWPDLLCGALLVRHWGRIAPQAAAGSSRIRAPLPRRWPSPGCAGQVDVAVPAGNAWPRAYLFVDVRR